MTPSLRQLEYIVCLADTGRFVEAARRCAVSQPALSKQIREVEQMLGVELFERTRPKVIVTEAGKEIVRRARELLTGARELVDAASQFAGAHQGMVRLGVIPTVAPYALPGLLVKLRRLFPEVSLAIHELQTEGLLERLKSGTIDLGLLAHPFDGQGLSGTDLVVEPFVLVAPRDHPLGVARSIRQSEIDGTDIILMEDGHCLRDQAIEACASPGSGTTAQSGTGPTGTSVNAASIGTLVRMVESGLGATLLPASALITEVRPGQGLVVRSFAQSPPGRTLTFQWRATSPKAPWFARLAAVLREHYLEFNARLPKVKGPSPRIRVA